MAQRSARRNRFLVVAFWCWRAAWITPRPAPPAPARHRERTGSRAAPTRGYRHLGIKRFFSTVQTQFLPPLVFTPVRSLEELNRRFWQWLETEYHQREHTALAGESPAQRFVRLGTSLRLLEANAPLDRLFFTRVNRRVRKDATFSLGADLWEVATHLRGQVITARFDPVSLARMEVWLGERFIGLAVRCDKHRNAKIHLVTNDYDREIY